MDGCRNKGCENSIVLAGECAGFRHRGDVGGVRRFFVVWGDGEKRQRNEVVVRLFFFNAPIFTFPKLESLALKFWE